MSLYISFELSYYCLETGAVNQLHVVPSACLINCSCVVMSVRGAVAEWVRESTGDRTFDGSSPISVKTFLFGPLAIPFTPHASVFRMRQ